MTHLKPLDNQRSHEYINQTMAKLKNRQVLQIYQALLRLDPGLDPQNKGKSAFIFKAKVAYTLARNFRNIRPVIDDLERIRVETFKKYQPSLEVETLTGEAARKFSVDFGEVLNEEVEFTFVKIDVNDLELDKNTINVDILAELMDVIIIGEIT